MLCPLGSLGVLGVAWPDAEPSGQSMHGIEGNWIKLLPSCLGTHAPVEAAARAQAEGHELTQGPVEVTVHPRARQAAHIDLVEDGLSAKFSIPYCVALAIVRGTPRVRDFASVDAEVLERSRSVQVVADPSLPEFGAVLAVEGSELARVEAPPGSPGRPAGEAQLAGKISDLAGARLRDVLTDDAVPAAAVLAAAGLSPAQEPAV
jgi:2-methylcitrate dehydratase PrpD